LAGAGLKELIDGRKEMVIFTGTAWIGNLGLGGICAGHPFLLQVEAGEPGASPSSHQYIGMARVGESGADVLTVPYESSKPINEEDKGTVVAEPHTDGLYVADHEGQSIRVGVITDPQHCSK
jgi:hypothetical protein